MPSLYASTTHNLAHGGNVTSAPSKSNLSATAGTHCPSATRASSNGTSWFLRRACCSQQFTASLRNQAPNADGDLNVRMDFHASTNACCARSSASAGLRVLRQNIFLMASCLRPTYSLNAASSPFIANATTATSLASPSRGLGGL